MASISWLLGIVHQGSGKEVQISLQDADFTSFGFIPRSRSAGSGGSSVFRVFLRKEVAF